MSSDSENGPVDETVDLSVQLCESIMDKIEVFTQGRAMPLVIVIGALEIVKSHLLIDAADATCDDND